MPEMKSIQLANLGLLGAALLSSLIALVTPGWLVGTNLSCGLFACTGSSFFGTITQGTAERVASIFLIIAIIGISAAIFLIYRGNKDDGNAIMKQRGAWTALSSALCILIGMATYTGIAHGVGVITLGVLSWGYSFVLGWVAFCLSLFGGIASKYLES